MSTPSWLSATKLRNHLMRDPLLDWLERFGEDRGYRRDDQVDGYDERTDFTKFIFERGHAFEAAIYKVLSEQLEIVHLERARISVEEQVARTIEVLRSGPEAVAQGCVAHYPTRTFGFPDLLVRSDVLARLWPDAMAERDVQHSAPRLGMSAAHYRVIDIKFTTLKLLKDGHIGNSGSAPAFKGQLFVYNRALGELQGYEPTAAYVMGRSWEQGSGSNKVRVRNALNRIGPVPMGHELARRVDHAVAWRRRVESEGHAWRVVPQPSVPELLPNMCMTGDSPWHTAKRQIAEEAGELTQLWQVGVDKRTEARSRGVLRLEDVASASDVGVNGRIYGPTLDAIIAVNRDAAAAPVMPPVVSAAQSKWGETPALEFYVDFETVSDLADDFTQLPDRGGQPLIFMIGCGHVEDGEWRFTEFCVDALTEREEADIIDRWLEHMATVRERFGLQQAQVMHWSPAETSSLESAYNSAVARHPGKNWEGPTWFDFLKHVMRAQPVVVKGALGFGLKAIAKAMHEMGLIETSWNDGPTDGLGAMVGAWRAAAEVQRAGHGFRDHALVRQIGAYNEVDTKVMWEIVRYLRRHHTAGGSYASAA